MGLFDTRMNDGSRHFASFPESLGASSLRDHLAAVAGLQVAGFLSDGVTETWIDFDYRGHRFTLNNPLGEYWLFVEDAAAPEALLEEVASMLSRLLERS